MTVSSAHCGGAWLVDNGPADLFTPEQLTDEHRLIGRTADEFVDQEVAPVLERLESKDWNLSRQLVRTCGELGLLGTDVPEAYGGVGLDKVSSIVVAESVARSASFGSTFGAQTGLAIIPLVCFGTEAQNARYLPRLVSGDLVGAYALSEAGSGSDALGARARATRQSDGSFVLTGEKMWITNCAFADLFIVFAKVDGEHFTAFIVERAFGGVSSGKEEHKMGLHGSSTAPLVLDGARVPAANVLGEVGKGHKVAFNVLNYGRFKLGAMTSGSSKHALGQAARYAANRRQFGQPIAAFGAIKWKLAEMTARTFAVESALYRTAGQLDGLLHGQPIDGPTLLAALEECAIEASIAKVAGSEALDYVLDENVQIHGGNGYVADYPAERQYRDARVNRIFEGTNEINRLLIPGLLVKRAMKTGASLAAPDTLAPHAAGEPGGALSRELAGVHAMKSATLLALGAAVQRFGEALSNEQEILLCLADLVIDSYLAESAVRRAIRSDETAHPAARHQQAAAAILVDSVLARSARHSEAALAATLGTERCGAMVARVRQLFDRPAIDTVPLRRQLADATVERGAYLFA